MSREHSSSQTMQDSSSPSPSSQPFEDEEDQSSYNAPTNLTRANSLAASTHADILNYVAKQQSKAIASKELLRHLIFTAVSYHCIKFSGL